MSAAEQVEIRFIDKDTNNLIRLLWDKNLLKKTKFLQNYFTELGHTAAAAANKSLILYLDDLPESHELRRYSQNVLKALHEWCEMEVDTKNENEANMVLKLLRKKYGKDKSESDWNIELIRISDYTQTDSLFEYLVNSHIELTRNLPMPDFRKFYGIHLDSDVVSTTPTP